MKKSFLLACALSACLAGLPPAYAQKSTEQFIPLGRSPGLSGEHTLIGRIEAVNPVSRSVTLAMDEKKATITVTERTRIWLDRSLFKLPNLKGNMADLVPNRWMEVKLATPDRQEAEWIKIESDAP
jgi:hypothetical protein